jgi:tryptophan-rich sensory protein
VAAVLANVADLTTYLRASPAVVATQETSPLPHMLGQVAGGITAKLVELAAIVVIVIAFRRRPRTQAALLVVYIVFGVAGAVVNSLVVG